MLLGALLSRVLGFEDLGQLLERLSSSFDSEEVNDDDFDENPTAVDNVYDELANKHRHWVLTCAYRAST